MSKLPIADYGVTAFDGIPVVNSRAVAENFDKRHENVMRDIQNVIDNLLEISSLKIESSDIHVAKYFIKTSYKERGKKYPEYLLTRDGFTLLVMGFTGKKAMAFKLAYIQRFNEMESFIKTRSLARLEYPELTDAIKSVHEEPKFYHYSNEADMINRIVIGTTAKQFRKEHGIDKDESIREHLTPWQAAAIQKLQRFDTGLVVAVQDFEQRKGILKTYFSSLDLQIGSAERRLLS